MSGGRDGNPATQSWDDVYFTARDGLRLHARHYRQPAGLPTRRPALCLPGLTRNASDFHALAQHLSHPDNPSARAVWAFDYRGRGRSASDPSWRNYSLPVELQDVLDLMVVAGLHDTAVIGTSRGGLVAMMMAAFRPASLGAVVLNDIGPVLEREGLLRIVAYVGRVPLPASWAEATTLVRDINARQFPAIPAHQWEDIARQSFLDDHGRPMQAYDQNLAKAMSIASGPLPELWPQFEALRRFPTLVIRGEFSDILSEATLAEMRLRHGRLATLTVKGQGHAPLLRDRPTLAAISSFLAQSDRAVDPPSGNEAVRRQ